MTGFRLKCQLCGSPELAAAAVLVDALPGAIDGELLGIKQMFHQHDQLDFAALVHAVSRAVLGRIQKAKLTLPIAQDVRLELSKSANLPDRVELLNRTRGGCGCHLHCSDLSSRAMSSPMPSRAGFPL